MHYYFQQLKCRIFVDDVFISFTKKVKTVILYLRTYVKYLIKIIGFPLAENTDSAALPETALICEDLG